MAYAAVGYKEKESEIDLSGMPSYYVPRSEGYEKIELSFDIMVVGLSKVSADLARDMAHLYTRLYPPHFAFNVYEIDDADYNDLIAARVTIGAFEIEGAKLRRKQEAA